MDQEEINESRTRDAASAMLALERGQTSQSRSPPKEGSLDGARQNYPGVRNSFRFDSVACAGNLDEVCSQAKAPSHCIKDEDNARDRNGAGNGNGREHLLSRIVAPRGNDLGALLGGATFGGRDLKKVLKKEESIGLQHVQNQRRVIVGYKKLNIDKMEGEQGEKEPNSGEKQSQRVARTGDRQIQEQIKIQQEVTGNSSITSNSRGKVVKLATLEPQRTQSSTHRPIIISLLRDPRDSHSRQLLTPAEGMSVAGTSREKYALIGSSRDKKSLNRVVNPSSRSYMASESKPEIVASLKPIHKRSSTTSKVDDECKKGVAEVDTREGLASRTAANSISSDSKKVIPDMEASPTTKERVSFTRFMPKNIQPQMPGPSVPLGSLTSRLVSGSVSNIISEVFRQSSNMRRRFSDVCFVSEKETVEDNGPYRNEPELEEGTSCGTTRKQTLSRLPIKKRKILKGDGDSDFGETLEGAWATNENTERSASTNTTLDEPTLDATVPIQSRSGSENAMKQYQHWFLSQRDEDGDMPIHMAVVHRDLPLVVKFLSLMTAAGISVDIFNNLRQTPLHLAIITKCVQILNCLLDAGASPNLTNRKGCNAVHLAIVHDASDCLEVLLRNDLKWPLDINARDYDGYTPLHLSILGNHPELFSTLLNHSSLNPDVVDGKSGRTALHYAAESGDCERCERLLERGADVNLANYAGITPLMSAASRKRTGVVTLLVQHGAVATGEEEMEVDVETVGEEHKRTKEVKANKHQKKDKSVIKENSELNGSGEASTSSYARTSLSLASSKTKVQIRIPLEGATFMPSFQSSLDSAVTTLPVRLLPSINRNSSVTSAATSITTLSQPRQSILSSRISPDSENKRD